MVKKPGLFLAIALLSQSAMATTLDYDCMKKVIDEETASSELLTQLISSSSNIMDVLSGTLGRFAGEVRNNSVRGDTCIASESSARTLT